MVKFIDVNSKTIEYCLYNLSQLVFEVTEDCNLNCEYCAFSSLYGERRESKHSKMEFETAKAVIDFIVAILNKYSYIYSPRNLNIGFYGGEPTMNFELIKNIVEYVNTLKHGISRQVSFSMTTNGVLLHKYIDFFVEHQFSLLISLDGDEKANSYRIDKVGNPSYKRVFENIKLVQDNYPDYFEKYISFNSVLNNLSNEKDVMNFFKESFNKPTSLVHLSQSYVNSEKVNRFYEICNSARNINHVEIKNEDDAVASPHTIFFYNDYARLSGNVYYDFNDLYYNKSEFAIVPTGTCIPFSKKMFVTVHGKILQCERIDHKFSLGCISGGSVILDYNTIAFRFNEINRKFIKQCATCAYIRHCSRCMYRLNDLEGEKECMTYRMFKEGEVVPMEQHRQDIKWILKGIYKLKIVK